MDPFVGEIRIFTWNWAPKGWAACNGATMNLQQNVALYSLIGVLYGGNGTTNFNLPDLRGRSPRHVSQQQPQVGVSAGSENVTLLASNLPLHTHSTNVVNATGTGPGTALAGRLPSNTNGTTPIYIPAAQAGTLVALNAASVAAGGASAPVANMQPWVTANYCIAMSGIFPPRN
ncbi:microcystin-dependent protein [Nitrospirillum amazonense]|uniref:Microcystin-dependent protein n=1 Tax=Nitrospirillum amazonense TaxID=28077 RepID=A0A560FFM5_9PROT|nr:tail fiber protein [Nitrospirillum amazonense]TWB20399.1 microcystin-dependent protein [Nitrospirillum amazonense]